MKKIILLCILLFLNTSVTAGDLVVEGGGADKISGAVVELNPETVIQPLYASRERSVKTDKIYGDCKAREILYRYVIDRKSRDAMLIMAGIWGETVPEKKMCTKIVMIKRVEFQSIAKSIGIRKSTYDWSMFSFDSWVSDSSFILRAEGKKLQLSGIEENSIKIKDL